MLEINHIQNLQKMNRINVLNYIRARKSVTRPQIGMDTGLSLSSVTNIVDYLLNKKFVVEIGPEQSKSVGRKRTKLEFQPNAYSFIQIIIEAGSLTAAVTNLNGDVQLYTKAATPCGNCEIVPLVFDNIKRLLEENQTYEILGIGVAFSGMVLYNGNYTVSTLLQNEPDKPRGRLWETSGLLSRLEEQFKLPVAVENTTHVIARSILERYPKKYMMNSLFFDFSIGVGMVYFFQGTLIKSLVGEIGHTSIDGDGRKCVCGNTGCLETECSAEAIEQKAGRLLKEGKCGKLASLLGAGGDSPTFDDIVQASREGDTDIIDMLAGFGELLGRAFVNMINIFNPDVILINEGKILESGVIADTMIEYAFNRPLKKLSENLIIERVKAMRSDTVRGLAYSLSDRIFEYDTQNSLF